MSRARVHELDPRSPATFVREMLRDAGKKRKELIGSHIKRREVQNVLDDERPMSPEFIVQVATLTGGSIYHLTRLQTSWLIEKVEKHRKGLRKVLNAKAGCLCGSLDPKEWNHYLPGDDRMDAHHILDCPYVQAARALGFQTRKPKIYREED